MSFAFALFGAPYYRIEEAFDDSWDVPLAQYDTDIQAHGKHDCHGNRLDDTLKWRAEKGVNSSDGPPHKRPRPEAMILPPKMASSSLVPTQPTSPPPAHMLRANTYANTKLALTSAPVVLECPIRAENILRWITYAIRYGFLSLGIEVVDGWAQLHELAKAASSVRKDFAGLTPGALRSIIERDESGRWWLLGSCVRNIPRSDRRVDRSPMLRDESHDSVPPLVDYTSTGPPPAKKSFARIVAECHCALSECVYHYSLLEKSLCHAAESQ